ncbi:hypothetical protein KIPB_009877 [Kipferlia bialata]|uniref:Uncharacterized protein n=1 Tax=Kipferlia bialata TaxID=797122 RepID=A0A391NTU8_9EUKA|nr:hypothetical protein KIPB_009877 [Kipferlia bialata]|eukprot:g9877.t1
MSVSTASRENRVHPYDTATMLVVPKHPLGLMSHEGTDTESAPQEQRMPRIQRRWMPERESPSAKRQDRCPYQV